ncbi:MAG: adenylate/guanylate cyclase domain-containing protein [Acidimicrobiia bacterium]|nr:adenylate/guanylate cyclase domain-containing protein [Acidimicrobiia bacterium]NNF69875.1 adenylate/guanylate cyclase domain-containing protein [Acidimicrobiia bacterium]NNK92640.1 adenylate/guanylate cyclase domain-containing protein [Acidimicrobiia bacterium]
MSELFCHPDEEAVAFEGHVNVLEALVEAGIPITHLCGGKARCSTCRVRVAEGLDGLSTRTKPEEAMAQRLDFPPEVRLACQATASSSADLRRLVLDSEDAELASQLRGSGLRGPIGQDIEVAVLFADVVGFTTMSEALPAYDVVHMLNRFFHGASGAIEANHGQVDNYMGDAVLALFGVDGEESPSAHAIAAGLAILEVAQDLNHYVERVYDMGFGVRIGIDFGEVVYGLLGAETSARETAIGDPVNVASRLQNANKETGTEMLVSQAAASGCDKIIEFGRRFDLDLRGKVGMVTAYEVNGLAGTEGGTDDA